MVRGDIAVTNLLRIQQTRLNFAWRSPGRLFYFCLSWCHSTWLGKPGLQQSCQGCLQCWAHCNFAIGRRLPANKESSYSRAANARVIPLHDNNHW